MIDLVHRFVLPAAFSLLPPELASQRAAAMLLSIGLQESGFKSRRQVGGPARGFWQFEVAGVHGVFEHPGTKLLAENVLKGLHYNPWLEAAWVQTLLEHNDILAAAIARLLLWTLPKALPDVDEALPAWELYLACWRPGKPHVEPWAGRYRDAWARVSHPSGPTPLMA